MEQLQKRKPAIKTFSIKRRWLVIYAAELQYIISRLYVQTYSLIVCTVASSILCNCSPNSRSYPTAIYFAIWLHILHFVHLYD